MIPEFFIREILKDHTESGDYGSDVVIWISNAVAPQMVDSKWLNNLQDTVV